MLSHPIAHAIFQAQQGSNSDDRINLQIFLFLTDDEFLRGVANLSQRMAVFHLVVCDDGINNSYFQFLLLENVKTKSD